jgi:hypothetical protein
LSGEWSYYDLGGILPYNAATNYQQGQVVFGSDGLRYQCVNDNTLNHNPVGDNGTYWTSFSGLYPTSGVMVKGVQSRRAPTTTGCASMRSPDSRTRRSSGFTGTWSATTAYNQYDSVTDPYTEDIYVSKVASNTNHRPFGSPTQWAQGTWHTGKTYAANDAVMTWDGTRYNLWISQGSQSGHDPATDDGTNWKRASNGITFTATNILTSQKANFNTVTGRASGFGMGVAVLNGFDCTIDRMELSSNTIGAYVNSSGGRVNKRYAEACNIAVIFGHNCVYPVLDDEASSAGTTLRLMNVGSRLKSVNLRNGRVGADQYAAGTVAPNLQVPVIDYRLMRFSDTSAVTTYTFVGRKAVVDPGVVVQFRALTANRTLVDSSVGNVSLSNGTIAASSSAFSDPGASFTTNDVGKWIAIPGADVNDDTGVAKTLYTWIFARVSATQVTLATLATHAATGVATTYGSALVLAGTASYTPAIGDLIEFMSDTDGMWYETKRSKRAP